MPRDMAYLLDMLDAANRVKGYMAGINRAAFEDDEMRQLAVIKLIEIIGEAARRVSKEFQDLHPEIPWARMIRNAQCSDPQLRSDCSSRSLGCGDTLRSTFDRPT